MNLGFLHDVEHYARCIVQSWAFCNCPTDSMSETVQRELSTLRVSAVPKNPCSECVQVLRRTHIVDRFFAGVCRASRLCGDVALGDGKPIQRERFTVHFAIVKCRGFLAESLAKYYILLCEMWRFDAAKYYNSHCKT